MEVVSIKKILARNWPIGICLHCVRRSSWIVPTMSTLTQTAGYKKSKYSLPCCPLNPNKVDFLDPQRYRFLDYRQHNRTENDHTQFHLEFWRHCCQFQNRLYHEKIKLLVNYISMYLFFLFSDQSTNEKFIKSLKSFRDV